MLITYLGNQLSNVLNGHGGKDNITGGAGGDIFLSANPLDSRIDTILDFSLGDGDRFDVSALLDYDVGDPLESFVDLRNTRAGHTQVWIDADGVPAPPS